MSEKTKFYKFKDKWKFIESIKSYGSARAFAQAADMINSQVSRYVKDDTPIIDRNAIKIANAMKVDFDSLFIETQAKYVGKPKTPPRVKRQYEKSLDKDKSDLIVSEEIIVGLKLKLEQKLLITHSKSYVNEIMDTVDELIIEAAYLGVHCKENHKEKFIVNSITKRRTIK